MKDSNSLVKQLLVPVLGGIGLVYLSLQMIQDASAREGGIPTSMCIAIVLMVLAAVFSFFTAWKRYQHYKQEHPDVAEAEAPSQPKVDYASFNPSGNMCDGADAFANLIIGNRTLLNQFKKATYSGTFESYCCQLEGPMAYLGDTEEMEQLAEMILDRLEQNWNEEKRKIPFFTDQILISVYLMPALVYTQYTDAKEFAEIFRSAWKQRYPKNVFEIGTYEQICHGFEKRFGCFITTAVCQAQGKPDGCYELTRFRHFRDTWLANQADGKDLIARYYEIAPSIVNIINLQSNASKVYQQIQDTYLNPCLEAIESGDNEACLARYKSMVEELSLLYGV